MLFYFFIQKIAHQDVLRKPLVFQSFYQNLQNWIVRFLEFQKIVLKKHQNFIKKQNLLVNLLSDENR